MIIKKFESELKRLDSNLKGIAREMGTSNFAKETELNQKDVSAWVNDNRKFSYEKLIRIALKISDRVVSYRKANKDQS